MKISSPILAQYIKTFEQEGAPTPAIVSYNDAQEIIQYWQEQHGNTLNIQSLSDIRGEYIEGLFLYQTPEDKVEFPISEVRRCINDTSKIPYSGKHLYILIGIDTASSEAMNALLKTLEDTPDHAIILLVVSDREALIDTIHSRTLDLFRSSNLVRDERYLSAIHQFFSGKPTEWIELLFSMKPSKEDAMNILIIAVELAPAEWIERIEKGLIDLSMTHETPRNILDQVFLGKNLPSIPAGV